MCSLPYHWCIPYATIPLMYTLPYLTTDVYFTYLTINVYLMSPYHWCIHYLTLPLMYTLHHLTIHWCIHYPTLPLMYNFPCLTIDVYLTLPLIYYRSWRRLCWQMGWTTLGAHFWWSWQYASYRGAFQAKQLTLPITRATWESSLNTDVRWVDSSSFRTSLQFGLCLGTDLFYLGNQKSKQRFAGSICFNLWSHSRFWVTDKHRKPS